MTLSATNDNPGLFAVQPAVSDDGTLTVAALRAAIGGTRRYASAIIAALTTADEER